MNQPQKSGNEDEHDDVQVDEHKNAQGKYVQMSLLINEMDRQQIHHKYRATERMKKV